MMELFLHAENTLNISVLKICCMKARIEAIWTWSRARFLDDTNYFFNVVKSSFLQQKSHGNMTILNLHLPLVFSNKHFRGIQLM